MTEANDDSIYGFSAPGIDGREVALAEFRGKVVLIVNTASKCGLTPQYAGLEALYREYGERGLVVLGFPSTEFGPQAPGSEAKIGQFCERNYGVSFPLFSKTVVNGPGALPLFGFLRRAKPGWFGLGRIKWNFTKFLVDREGRVVRRYAPGTAPGKLAGAIEKLL